MTEQTRISNAEAYKKRLGSREVRRRTLDAAQKLFAERGIAAVSVREIAREVGVSHTLLHLYFGEKEQILREVLNRHDTDITEQLKANDDLAQGVAKVIEDSAGDLESMRVLAAAMIEGFVPERISVDFNIQHAFVERFLEGTKGEDAKLDPRLIGAAITCMMLGWAVSSPWLSKEVGFSDLSIDEIGAGLAKAAERMVRGPE